MINRAKVTVAIIIDIRELYHQNDSMFAISTTYTFLKSHNPECFMDR